jgi:hypothetical protein
LEWSDDEFEDLEILTNSLMSKEGDNYDRKPYKGPIIPSLVSTDT